MGPFTCAVFLLRISTVPLKGIWSVNVEMNNAERQISVREVTV